jgi:hypothetical protein
VPLWGDIGSRGIGSEVYTFLFFGDSLGMVVGLFFASTTERSHSITRTFKAGIKTNFELWCIVAHPD